MATAARDLIINELATLLPVICSCWLLCFENTAIGMINWEANVADLLVGPPQIVSDIRALWVEPHFDR